MEEDKAQQEQRLKVYTGRSTPAQASGSREDETQERTIGDSTAKKAQQFRGPQEGGQHHKGKGEGGGAAAPAPKGPTSGRPTPLDHI